MSIGLAKVSEDFIYIGADSQITYNDSDSYNDVDIKIFEVNGVVGAFAGETPQALMYKAFLEQQDPDVLENTDDFTVMIELVQEFVEYLKTYNMSLVRGDEIIGHALLGTKNKVWLIEEMFIQDSKDYAVIGSGDILARSVLYTGGGVHSALDTACKFNIHCSYPVSIFRINRDTGAIDKRIIDNPTGKFIADTKLF